MIDKNALYMFMCDHEELTKVNRDLAKSIKQASEADIEARDRVNIPLREYEKMRMLIESLRRTNEYHTLLLEKLGIPSAADIDLDTVRVWRNDMMSDMLNPLAYQGIKYRIEFVVKKVK